MQLKIRKINGNKICVQTNMLLQLIPGAVTYFNIGHHTTCK